MNRLIGLALIALFLTSCVQLPDHGPFVTATPTREVWQAPPRTRHFDEQSRQIPILTLTEGPALFEYTYRGEGNFIVWLLHADDRPVELVANRIGTSEGMIFIRIPSWGIYHLEVISGGDSMWTIDVTQ